MRAATPFAIDVPDSLLARARAGELAAFETLYRLFERPAYTLAARLLGDRDEAQEVLHDAMLKAMQNIASYRSESPFWGWLRQITANEALMRLRRRGRVEYSDELPEPHGEPDREPDGSAPPEIADAGRLQALLGELPETTRTVIWLYHAEGYTHEEIGQLMGRTTSFSKSQLARGTRRLREMLGADAEVGTP